MNPTYITAADLFGTWLDELERGEPPIKYAVPAPFETLDLRPGRLVLIGGPPGCGKTALVLQVLVELLRWNPNAKAMLANVEMSPVVLLERIVARLANVPLSAIMDRTLTLDEQRRIQAARGLLDPIAARLAFLHAPYTLEHVAAAGTAFDADVIVIDYLQRFVISDNQREQLETASSILRRFCDMGACVMCISAVARQKAKNGSTYKGLSLASFRGSSECEYTADLAYLLVSHKGQVTLQAVKHRFGVPTDIALQFDGTTQTFKPAPGGLGAFDTTEPADEWQPQSRRGSF